MKKLGFKTLICGNLKSYGDPPDNRVMVDLALKPTVDYYYAILCSMEHHYVLNSNLIRTFFTLYRHILYYIVIGTSLRYP